MSTDEMQDNDEIVKILYKIEGSLELIREQIKPIPDLDDRITVLERNESRNEGGLSTIRALGTVFGALIISALGWLYHTTYANNNDVLLLLQRVGNLEQVIHDAHK